MDTLYRISDPEGIGFILTQNTFLIINSQHYENYKNIFLNEITIRLTKMISPKTVI